MKYKLYLLTCFQFIVNFCDLAYSQDIINPYILRESSMNSVSSDLTPEELISGFYFETVFPTVSTSSGYNGEYMISLKYHHWHGSSTSSSSSYYGYENYAKTYSIELVSFPFMMNCFDGANACNSTSNVRNLETPDANHPYNGLGWGDLVQYHFDGTFRFSDGMSAQDIGQCPDRLVSFLFKNGYNSGSGCATTLPHSILKQTVYLHCGTLATDDTISSFSWYYDNTRGIMRAYPFYDNNSSTGLADALHDVMFAPMIIEDKLYPEPNGTNFVNRYDRADNYNPTSGGIIEGGTIDYFPYSDIKGCTEFAIPNSTEEFSLVNNAAPFPFFDHFHPFPSQYLLMNTFLRNANGKTLAGYDIGGLSSNIIEPKIDVTHRINQNYFITNDFDGTNDGVIQLDIINQNEKVIFNPSEVTINPDGWDPSNNNPPIEVIFPENYTFKSILGRYPSKQEVLDASLDPQNGNCSDLRQVPVPVDAVDWPWTTTNTYDYPEVSWDDPSTTDVNGFLKDERFGYYYIENKATITVRPCVKIYDARFLVSPGGTMRFDDYPQILGFEDKDSNRGRYKIRSEGGAVLRNYSNVQFVQNGDIFQTIPLNYIAKSHIIAGENVDPDTDQPQGIYEIKSGADVTFTSGSYIHLTNGFYVSGGDFHAVINENLPVPAICYTNNGQNGGNRVQQQAVSPQIEDANIISIAPNPNQGDFTIDINGFNSISAVSLFDLSGRLIYYKTELNKKSHEVQLPPNNKGLMIAKIVDNNGQTQMKKVMVE